VRFSIPDRQREHENSSSSKAIRQRDDPKFASAKMAAFQYLAVGIFLFLVTGFWELQIKSPEIYNERAERNRIKALRSWRREAKFLTVTGG